jgi:hypothetical protein
MAVADASSIARRTRRKICENRPLAAVARLSLVVVGAAMALSSVSVVRAALRLARWRPGRADRITAWGFMAVTVQTYALGARPGMLADFAARECGRWAGKERGGGRRCRVGAIAGACWRGCW